MSDDCPIELTGYQPFKGMNFCIVDTEEHYSIEQGPVIKCLVIRTDDQSKAKVCVAKRWPGGTLKQQIDSEIIPKLQKSFQAEGEAG